MFGNFALKKCVIMFGKSLLKKNIITFGFFFQEKSCHYVGTFYDLSISFFWEVWERYTSPTWWCNTATMGMAPAQISVGLVVETGWFLKAGGPGPWNEQAKTPEDRPNPPKRKRESIPNINFFRGERHVCFREGWGFWMLDSCKIILALYGAVCVWHMVWPI